MTATTTGNGTATCTPSPVTEGGGATCTATPVNGSTFTGWTGACAGQGATCTLNNITANLASVAAFQVVPTNVQQIPTLSEWGLILTAMLMGFAALITFRKVRKVR